MGFLFFLQCWENCELLQSNFQVWGAMCEEKEICVSIIIIFLDSIKNCGILNRLSKSICLILKKVS